MNVNSGVRICRICGIGSDVNRFSYSSSGKIQGRRCLKCCSKINNEKLKNKEGGNYYAEYYIKNKEEFAIRDRARYLRNKALKNQVLFEFENLNISESNENVNSDEINV